MVSSDIQLPLHSHPTNGSAFYQEPESYDSTQVGERRDSFLFPFATMETSSCHVFYVDRRVESQTVDRRTSLKPSTNSVPEVRSNLDSLLSTFPTVHTFSSGRSCLSRISDLDNKQNTAPIIVMIHVPAEEEMKMKRTASQLSPVKFYSQDDSSSEIYGLQLLSHLVSETRMQKLSKLIIPFVLASGFNHQSDLIQHHGHGPPLLLRFMDAGAVDVFASPISKEKTESLLSHAYRAFKEVTKSEIQLFSGKHRERKLSWVGVDEEKPFGYLRESMVSNLMLGICSPEKDIELVGVITSCSPKEWEDSMSADRKSAVSKAVGLWSFSAHDFSDDELMYAAFLMLKHTLEMPDLAKWRLNNDGLIQYLQACRAGYNTFVHYHNFRHVIDVLQAVFAFLLSLGVVPPYPSSSPSTKSQKCSLSSLLSPTDALILLISAVGHDLGHPGVNNAFLVSLNAPLAQLYNDRSVLESFHCAAYSQILRRYWPTIFKDSTMRKSNVNIILATDMGVHFKYMADLAAMNIKMENAADANAWPAKEQDETKDLLCGLLIKCADISNVARIFDVAKQWANILTDEFANQGAMEEELGIPTCLFGGPPTPGNTIQLANSQIGFINLFALPLFQGVAKILPGMMFGVDELTKNKEIWSGVIKQQKEKIENGVVGNSEEKSLKSPNNDTSHTSITSEPHTSLPLSSDEELSSGLSSPTVSSSMVSPTAMGVTPVALPLTQTLIANSIASPSMNASSPPSQPLPQPPVSSGSSSHRGRSISPGKKLRKKNPPDAMLERRPSSPTLAGGYGPVPVLPIESGPNGVGSEQSSTVENGTSKEDNGTGNGKAITTSTVTSPNTNQKSTPKKKKSRRSLWLGEHFSHSSEAMPSLNATAFGNHVGENEHEEEHSVPGWKKLLFSRRKKSKKDSFGNGVGLVGTSETSSTPGMSKTSESS